MIDFNQHPAYLAFAEGVLQVKFDMRAVTWLTSLDQNGSILGVVVFSRFTTGNCEVTVAARTSHFLTKRFLLASCAYPFIQLGCRRVTAIIAAGNERSLSLAQQLGFKEEGELVDWFPSGNAKILGLLRKNCKWLKDYDNGLSIPTGSPRSNSHG